MKWKKGSVNSKLTQSEQQVEKEKKSKNSVRDLWENIKQTNIHITGISAGERRKE